MRRLQEDKNPMMRENPQIGVTISRKHQPIQKQISDRGDDHIRTNPRDRKDIFVLAKRYSQGTVSRVMNMDVG